MLSVNVLVILLLLTTFCFVAAEFLSLLTVLCVFLTVQYIIFIYLLTTSISHTVAKPFSLLYKQMYYAEIMYEAFLEYEP